MNCMGNPVMWFELLVENPEKSNDFYNKLFDWKINSDNPKNYGFVNTGSEKGIHGGIGHPGHTGEKSVMIYIEVDDLDLYLKKAIELGGTSILEPQVIDGFPIAIFQDLDGHRIGLIKKNK